jgi:hypothetical protein
MCRVGHPARGVGVIGIKCYGTAVIMADVIAFMVLYLRHLPAGWRPASPHPMLHRAGFG